MSIVRGGAGAVRESVGGAVPSVHPVHVLPALRSGA